MSDFDFSSASSLEGNDIFETRTQSRFDGVPSNTALYGSQVAGDHAPFTVTINKGDLFTSFDEFSATLNEYARERGFELSRLQGSVSSNASRFIVRCDRSHRRPGNNNAAVVSKDDSLLTSWRSYLNRLHDVRAGRLHCPFRVTVWRQSTGLLRVTSIYEHHTHTIGRRGHSHTLRASLDMLGNVPSGNFVDETLDWAAVVAEVEGGGEYSDLEDEEDF